MASFHTEPTVPS